jgi:hypothetical protein
MRFILTSTLCLCAVVLVCHKQTRAQTVPEPPTIVDFFPFDTYGKISTDDEKARLDNLAIHLLEDPKQVAYIFVYAGQQPCAGETQAKIAFIKNHLVKTRGIEPDRVIVRDGGHREELTVELWPWTRAGEVSPPSAAPTIDPGEVRMRRNCNPISRRRRGRHSRSPQ